MEESKKKPKSKGFSRKKGSREERALVQDLLKRGFKNVRRVPLSGSQPFYKFDVIAEFEGNPVTFELKTRNNYFKWLYTFYYEQFQKNEVYRGAMRSGGPCVAIGQDPFEVQKVGIDYIFQNEVASSPEKHKMLNRIFKLEKTLQKGADFLVIKDNRKARLFIKYWFTKNEDDLPSA